MIMHDTMVHSPPSEGITLVIGGTGKTGRRVADRLLSLGRQTRVVSRSASPSFDWNEKGTWDAALAGVTTAYITYAPDLAIPGATAVIRAFVGLAVDKGVKRLVLLSGRGEEEAQACERIVQEAGIVWTIVRASWFDQNFSEGELLGMVLDGVIALPTGDVPEPFVDAEDIADVAVAALTEEGHDYEIYEVTGPRLLTFADVAHEISNASGREVGFMQIPKEAFAEAVTDSGAPEELVWLLNYLFETVLDGRNAYLGNGVQRALGREPRDFTDFARRTGAQGTWNPDENEVAA
jgi:uncharacterized protein YbjT (DUF2867 family)